MGVIAGSEGAIRVYAGWRLNACPYSPSLIEDSAIVTACRPAALAQRASCHSLHIQFKQTWRAAQAWQHTDQRSRSLAFDGQAIFRQASDPQG